LKLTLHFVTGPAFTVIFESLRRIIGIKAWDGI